MPIKWVAFDPHFDVECFFELYEYTVSFDFSYIVQRFFPPFLNFEKFTKEKVLPQFLTLNLQQKINKTK